MKVIAFNGSARKDGNTARLIREVFKPLTAAGIECELVQLAGETIRGCTACGACRKNLDRRCVVSGDIVNDCIARMAAADAIIIGSPTYFFNVTAETKALIDRSGYVARGNGSFLTRKVGAAVVAVRRAGAVQTFNAINDFFFINGMIVPGASYLNIGLGGPAGSVESDEEGLQTMQALGENMAWLLKKIAN
jgi:multimeric flavodoxin WrbA